MDINVSYDTILIKNAYSSLCYDVIIVHQIFKSDKFGDFSGDIDYKCKTDVFRDVIYFIITDLLADTKC